MEGGGGVRRGDIYEGIEARCRGLFTLDTQFGLNAH